MLNYRLEMSVLIVSIEEAKKYLRVDSDEESALITDMINSAEEICEGILRFPLTEFDKIPETVKVSILFIVSNMYEKREEANMKEVIELVTRLLFSYRKESW